MRLPPKTTMTVRSPEQKPIEASTSAGAGLSGRAEPYRRAPLLEQGFWRRP